MYKLAQSIALILQLPAAQYDICWRDSLPDLTRVFSQSGFKHWRCSVEYLHAEYFGSILTQTLTFIYVSFHSRHVGFCSRSRGHRPQGFSCYRVCFGVRLNHENNVLPMSKTCSYYSRLYCAAPISGALFFSSVVVVLTALNKRSRGNPVGQWTVLSFSGLERLELLFNAPHKKKKNAECWRGPILEAGI